MKFHDFETLEEMHVEITNRCNAACPMCARNVHGGRDQENLVLAEWSKGDAERVFSTQFARLRNILFCGTHGDPAVAKEALSIVEAAKVNSNATVEFYSNGSVRTPEWWHSLGKMLNTKKADGYYRQYDLGVFSIDGLADTNVIYRRQTNFERIIENARAFIKAGGRARWDFLVFKHNEHQVLEAEQLAKSLGFKQFRIRKTSRFAYSPDGPDKYRVQNRSGEFEYYIEPPTQPEYLNSTKKSYEALVQTERSGSLNLKGSISCLNKTQFNRMYINAHLKVYPCCFISSDTYPVGERVFSDTHAKVTTKYGVEFNSLRSSTWQQIFDHPWFRSELVESWNNPDQKLVRCQRTCSSNLNPIISQSMDRPKLDSTV